MIDPAWRQSAHRVRHDWAAAGAAAIAAPVDVVVVVDVLSFTTTLSVAADLGVRVLPCPWDDDAAATLAVEHDAVLAVGRRAARPGQVSLSPTTVREADPRPARLVLPSPNGAALAHRMVGSGVPVLGACLRNATAVAAWIDDHHDRASCSVAVVSAGERWSDGSVRPAVEDLWGAGAVIAALSARGWRDLSPEAAAARAAYRAIVPHVLGPLNACAGGRELAATGFGTDVDIAAELDRGVAVPVLDGPFFVPA